MSDTMKRLLQATLPSLPMASKGELVVVSSAPTLAELTALTQQAHDEL